jgi:excinuclease ABC subunit C
MKKNLIKKIKKAPKSPGVYLFKNKKGEVIYVGRAANLKNRLENYLHPVDFKIRKMVDEANDLKIKKTKNLLEAIILEANLIKKYEPIYNTKEKDNRSFVYIVIPKIKWSYPRIVRQREVEKYLLSESFVFGPLRSYSLAKNFLLLVRKIFPYSTCKLNQGKPCFHYQIGLCSGKCLGKINESEYQEIIDNLINFLKGENKKVKKFLTEKFKEKLYFLEHFEDISLIDEEKRPSLNKKIEAYDISHFSGKETVGSLIVFENNDFNKSLYRRFKIKKAKPFDDFSALKEVLERRFNHSEWQFPDLILIDGGKAHIKVAEKVLEKMGLKIPVVGIAKFKNDKLIFGQNVKKSVKELLEISFETLKKIRDEAHRFANSYRKKLFKIGKSHLFSSS